MLSRGASQYPVRMTQPPSPTWQPSRIDVGRRRALIGLSGIVVAAMHAERAWAERAWPVQRTGPTPQSCVLTPEAGEGPFYLDPKLIRGDITSGQSGAPLQLAMQVVRAGDCATLSNARESMSGTRTPSGCTSGYRNSQGFDEEFPWRRPSASSTARHAVHRRARERAVPHHLPQLVRRSHTTRPLKVFLGGKEVVADQVFIFRARSRGSFFNEWQPYKDHVSKRRTFNDNDPIRQGIYSTVARQRGSYAATAVLRCRIEVRTV